MINLSLTSRTIRR